MQNIADSCLLTPVSYAKPMSIHPTALLSLHDGCSLQGQRVATAIAKHKRDNASAQRNPEASQPNPLELGSGIY